MITVRLKIGDGPKVDTETLGLIYLDSDKRTGAPSKGFESTSYPEEEGEHILPKTVDDAFDYTVKFFIDPSVVEGQSFDLQTANAKISAFNRSLYDYVLDDNNNPTSVKEYKQVTFYNDYKRHKIVGYPSEISEATEFWRDTSNQVNDVVVVEWKIRVTKPSLCEFKTPFSDDTSD